jgi:hypothetical protein
LHSKTILAGGDWFRRNTEDRFATPENLAAILNELSVTIIVIDVRGCARPETALSAPVASLSVAAPVIPHQRLKALVIKKEGQKTILTNTYFDNIFSFALMHKIVYYC